MIKNPLTKNTVRLSLLCATAMVCLNGLPPLAHAQVPEAQTGTAGAGRAEEQIRVPETLLRIQPKIEVREAATQAAPEGADKITFDLKELQLEGMTVYTADQAASVYGDFLGKTISLADLYSIAADLTRKYRNDGYILTQVVVPPQTIEDGTARLMVVEGYLGNVRVEGDEGENDATLKLMNDYLAHVQDGAPLNVKDLERVLLLINDLPGISSRAVISPSASQGGAADLLVRVSRKKYDAMVGIDNYGSRYLGPVQLTGAASYNSLFGFNEKITGQLAVAPDPGDGFELAYGSLSYLQPLFRQYGTTVEITASLTDTDPGFDLKSFDVQGRSEYASVTLDHPFIRTRALNFHAYGKMDLRNVETRNNFEAKREDRIRAARVGGTLEFLDTTFGKRNPGFNFLNVEISKGIDIFNATDGGRANSSRPSADMNFKKIEAQLQRIQRLSPEFNLLMGAEGQWSASPLVSSEEFGFGGTNFGRAYDPSEILGDEGLGGKLELQWTPHYEVSNVTDYQLYSFYDAGIVWNDDPTTSSQKRNTATSAGFGVRADILENTSANFAVAVPLTRIVQTQRDDDPRVYMSLSHKF